MNLRQHERGRAGFTLIELLMVIAIIGVLVSLLMAAVFKVTGSGEQAMVRSEISQLSQGITAFMAKYGLKNPPPSRLFLAASRAQYGDLTVPGLQKDSYEYLTTVWPRLAWVQDPNAIINWGNWPTGKNPPVILEGHQTLVFFLGGIPAADGCTGFSNNPRDPSALAGDRIRFFDFKANRLLTPNGQPWVPGTFYAYKDAYEKAPYAYFSSYKQTNNYNRYFPLLGNSDCNSLGTWPYATDILVSQTNVVGKYLNPDTYQIISAGPDGAFGPGTRLPNANPKWLVKQSIYRAGEPGYDDIANFHDRQLGLVD
jgi:general secretion pathway protein G